MTLRRLTRIYFLYLVLESIIGKHLDITESTRSQYLAGTLQKLLDNTTEDIVWKLSNNTKTILTDVADDFLRVTQFKRILINETIICETSQYYTPNYVVIAYFETTETFVNYLKCAKYAKHLVIVDEDILRSENLTNLLNILWKEGILDVTFAIISEKLQLYTWFPMDLNNNCGRITNMRLLPSNNTNVFPKKIAKHLPNCSLRCAWIDAKPFSDLYIKVFEMISAKTSSGLIWENRDKESGINLRLLNKEAEYGYKFYWEESMQKIFENDNVDVLFGYTFINSSTFAYGPMFYTDASYIAVRKAPRILSYRPLLKVFNIYIFIYMFCVYLFVSILIITLKSNGVNLEIFFTFFRLCLANSLPSQSYVEKITKSLFISFTFYSLILNTLYLSKLSSILTNPAFEEPLASREDLYINNLKTIFNHYLEQIYCVVFYASDNPDAIKNCIMVNMSVYDMLIKEVKEQNNSVLSFISILDTYPHLATRVDYFPTFLDEATLYHSYILNKNNPKNAVINYWATEMIEKGLLIKWWNDMKLISTVESYKYMLDDIHKPFTILSLSHLNESFLIIIYGYILSIIIFLLEFFTYFLMKKINLMRDISLV